MWHLCRGFKSSKFLIPHVATYQVEGGHEGGDHSMPGWLACSSIPFHAGVDLIPFSAVAVVAAWLVHSSIPFHAEVDLIPFSVAAVVAA